ncbi:hypothetical protein [Promicromonospora iranensis]|uniref:Transcriptional regulator n=1 Tax=Promicromonospora iranensis TaxID=1105144 RepID=A0ABU2CR11_9MICO|nr:hypothetical protein [Promicromonospora iranensis]MDR7383597.1 hypothetical protein [Promicromonospora iranensis]
MVTDTRVPSIESTGQDSVVDKLVHIPRTTSVLASDASVLRYELGWLVDGTDQIQRRAFSDDLERRQAQRQKLAPRDLLDYLNDLGFSWRDIARLAGVSVPAVQKWRRGSGVAATNHAALAKVVALTEILGDHSVMEIASWLEIPLKEGVSLSRMDMLIAGRYDLVMLSVANEGMMGVDAILDKFDENWREILVDDNFETFVDADGILSIRPKASQ